MSTADQLASAFEAMADGVLIADTRTGAVLANAAARAMLGLGDEPLTTRLLSERTGFYPFDLIAADDGGPIREQVRIGGRTLHSIVSPLVEGGATVGAVVVLRDLGRERAPGSEALPAIVHELRTPLASIAGALDIVRSGYAGELNDKQIRYVDMAKDAATRIGHIVDRLVEKRVADDEAVTVQRVPMAIGRLVRDVVARYAEPARAKGVRLDVQTAVDDVELTGDPDKLARVLGNLLSNSIKFAAVGGRVDVEVFGPPAVTDAVGVSVWNDGEPLPAAERERIFSAPTAAGRRVIGTGLGLGSSRAIVEAHGGRIWVESSAAGTQFVFTLPAQGGGRGDRHVAPPALGRVVAADAVRALVVEDDPRAAYLIKGLLMAAGHQVTVAADADAALAAVRAESFGLAVVSAAVPDATALLAILEHDPDTRKLAVLVLAEAARHPELVAIGADECLERPVHPAAFQDVCARMLVEAGRREARRILVVDDDSAVRAICVEILQQAGYNVRDLGTPETALTEARRFRPDLILLDVMMPVVDGFRTAERLRADNATGLTPIIFLSARGETADKVRAFRSGAEDYVVKPFDAVELVARVGKALARSTRELGASPTTQLPGADAVAAEIEGRIAAGDHGAVCAYVDLDNFKAFNDYFGLARADAVIRQTGDLMREVVERLGGPGDFIGHIAGDDFVMVVDGGRVDAVCLELIARFDRLIPLYSDREERRRGYIEGQDRWGVLRRFPVMTVSIAALGLAGKSSFGDVAAAAAAGKSLAKAVPSSAYVRDGVRLLPP
ncbi:MAG TPA: response regulator, partial [Kofleriaceae bacterium]|nr:response regulator [Kofleriaceae bacterium]